MHLRKISEKNKFLVYIRNSVMDSTLCFNFKVCSKSIRYFSNPICFFFFFLDLKNEDDLRNSNMDNQFQTFFLSLVLSSS